MHIGVLALQGDFEKHQHILHRLGATSEAVRYSEQLDRCSGLIIPGGESTTLTRQIEFTGMREPLLEFANKHPVFGTCAGMIMLGSNQGSDKVHPLAVMDYQVERNGWGRQVHSFSTGIHLEFDPEKVFKAVFIRAPRFKTSKNIRVLARYGSEPVLVTDNRHLAASFHPELGTDERIHRYFLDMVNE